MIGQQDGGGPVAELHRHFRPEFLQQHIETALSRKLLAGDITDHSRVAVDFKRGELVFEAKAGKK